MDKAMPKTNTTEVKPKKKVLHGTIVSDKMKDTVVVSVSQYTKHPKYVKYIQVDKRYKVHDLGNKHKVGEKVAIEETAPISRHKRFKILES
jgi:small subunit ribosomal protein S17